jgi:predicted Zn-dependent protease
MLLRIVTVLVVLCLSAPPAAAQGRMSFIRDAEIENTIRMFSEPIFRTAGVTPRAVDIHIVNDQTLNAFVTGGQTLFLHTGLLMNVDDAGELIGVIAHETGHIAGGHTIQGADALADARRTALISTLLGIAAAIASGDPRAGPAVMGGGMQLAERTFLGYTRGMENAADQAALSYLDRTGISSEGLLSFMEALEDQELAPTSRQAEYVRTHPLTRDRVDALRTHVDRSPATGRALPAGWDERFARMQAKLIGFLMPHVALRQYADDPSVAGRYGRAIALYRSGDLEGGLAVMNELLREAPDDPYFNELVGQMLLEHGRLDEARRYYQRAVDLLPDEPLILVALAQTKIDSRDPAVVRSAITDLERAVRARGGATPLAWRLLATAYGRSGEMGMAALALAEEAMATGDGELARRQSQRAVQELPRGSSGWLRAQDIRRAAERL